MTRRIVAGALALALLVAAGLGVLTFLDEEDDPFETYCSEVEDQREPLGEALAAGGDSAGLILALPIFRELMEQSPEDLIDEWSTVVAHVQELADVLEDAGVDPATYDRKALPEGVTSAERESIDRAATALGSPVMRDAMAGVQQQARDVCGTPLVL
ncbi:hypothetical protein HNR19_002252 [Nocardioides thalensis]|uniref:Uncharacterized protein n=1 Tax=Nocardioides thalensis TaxID=1914755 RepID=A0A853C2I4_9ACTN|nr:hypothetical protein [Nocardioides thalensis]NYJ01554.1 hypothetical protein [Nocardioides thalensis]